MKSPKERRKSYHNIGKVMKEKFKDPEYKKQHAKQQSKIMKEKWEDPEFRAKVTAKNQERSQDPEYRIKMSETLKERWENPELRANASETQSKRLEDPITYWKHREMTQDTAPVRSKKMKANWEDPDFCYRIMKGRYGTDRAKQYVWEKFGVER